MSNTNELDKTIEELEAEVIAELDEAKAKQPNDSGLKKEPGSKIDGERQDMGPAVVSPDAKSDPGKEATKKAKPIKGDAQQKGEKSAEPMKKKLAAGDEIDHDGEDLDEKSSKKEDFPPNGNGKFPPKKNMKKDDDEEEEDEVVDENDEDEEEKKKDKKDKTESRIKDIDVAEDVEALINDEDDLSEQFKTKAATIFEAAVKSKVRIEVERISEEMTSDFETNLTLYKEELTEKVDNYLNYVVDQWSKDNELAIERGLKGEIAEDFISGLQQLFVDHYIDVPDEKYDVLEAQSDKISELEDKINGEMERNVSLKESNDVYMREQVISEVSQDLADTEVEKFKALTEDVDFTDADGFREKLETLKDNYFPKVAVDNNSHDENDDPAQDIDTTGAMSAYMSAISRNKARAS
jgi:hypothetical protein